MISLLIPLILVCAIIGVLIWCARLVVPAPFQNIVVVVIVLVALLYLVGSFGGLGGFHGLR